jgi:stage V sporulation protein B
MGVYRGVQLFAFLPYQMLLSITFILFPMLARASAEGDRSAVRDYTRTGVRLALLLTGLMCGAVSALAPHVLRFAFPEEIWTQGGDALRILSLGMGAFAILGITCAALTSIGHARSAALFTAAAVVLVTAGCTALVPRAPFGPAMLLRAAMATSAALTIVAIGAALWLAREAGGFVAASSMLRILAALSLAVALGSRFPWIGRVGLLVEVGVVAVIYLAALIGMRELRKQDIRRLMQVVGRRA